MPNSSSRRPPTLDEVAALAGVSRAAASRAVNNGPNVSTGKREAVERAVRELGYVPNRSARALATQRTGIVVLGISLAETIVLADPFFARIMVGISDVLEQTDLHLILALAATERGEARLKNLLHTRGVDGIFPMAVRGGDDPLGRIVESSGLPAVYGGRPLDQEPPWYVDADNYGGARTAVEHLIRTGRTRIAMISGLTDTRVVQDRSRAFRESLALAGLAAYGERTGDFSDRGGAEAMRSLLAEHPELDAVFVQSDYMAIGALEALRDADRSVPGDVAVVGFDDVRATDPPLTTVHQPVEAMGREMARMLLDVLSGGSPSPVVLPTSLIVRRSA